ncbi:phosphonate metabolism protein/1,5-bisphosphokinase (PRPP-forming) PhnN [Mesorhizobium sp. BAC0120]|uniref:phosphonate metabolism protein/1,5-bisphosphokinase (PRPP-forming) PhnN n=1 Tax=Mesorhizobium sp. BAC0120 TaxID=3090670 RepID=UPI00298CEFCC|nr:phosphonate metabolism protein/1,5-bisphosphokinase (PRPP-forming) PhnN [Mesorhizobium sp. BAC0120]MDW6025549.1 phosphonate metabolism protein/1,5-bisphosphokinase (PRPP-forming) PhnN [Mesorhizobium sp. BAC0120]
MMVSALIERELASTGSPIRNGVFVAVVGPSGAGKDTLIGYAREAFAGSEAVEFVRRVITRPSDIASEDHDSLADEEFEEARKAGAFAVSWPAHGLHYGLPVSVDRSIADGHVAVANISRGAIPLIKARYANVVIVEVTASPEILAQRLSARGRESRGEVLARLARSAELGTSLPGAIRIDNSGSRDEAGERFVAVLRKAIAFADVSGTV